MQQYRRALLIGAALAVLAGAALAQGIGIGVGTDEQRSAGGTGVPPTNCLLIDGSTTDCLLISGTTSNALLVQ